MTMGIQGSSPLAPQPLLYDPNALTPDALMVYLSTRLNGLDAQIQDIFTSQNGADKIRASLNDIQEAINSLPTSANKGADLNGAEAVKEAILNSIDAIHNIDPQLAEQITAQLSQEGYILSVGSTGEDNAGSYKTIEIDNTKEYMKNLTGELESAAQMNMIRLQSLMSSRQTAVSLATNLIGKLGDSIQKVVENIR